MLAFGIVALICITVIICFYMYCLATKGEDLWKIQSRVKDLEKSIHILDERTANQLEAVHSAMNILIKEHKDIYDEIMKGDDVK